MHQGDIDRLLREALSLPDGARADLAARLIDSLDRTVDADASEAWSETIARRVAELDAGTAQTVAWPELRRQLMQRLDDASAA